MKKHSLTTMLVLAAIALPTAAAADWTLGANEQGGVSTVFMTRSTTYEGGVAFVCDNVSAAQPEYILLVSSTPFDAALGRLDVAMGIGAASPTTLAWTAAPRDRRLRSPLSIVVRDVLLAMSGAAGLEFTMRDDFGREYRIAAPVENLLEIVPEFLAACDALPPPAPLRF